MTLKAFLIFFSISSIGFTACDELTNLNNCGKDWIPSISGKCYLVIDKLGTADEAIQVCKKAQGGLITIESEEEQEMLENILSVFRDKSENAWIGLKMNATSWTWVDGKEIKNVSGAYENWDEEAITDGTQTCAKMSLSTSNTGKWVDDVCNRKILIACQKKQEWNANTLKDALQSITKKISDKLTELDKKIEKKTTTGKSSVPVGFIYIQLPKQEAPEKIWPSTATVDKWTDVSKDYANLFFRVVGDKSAAFEAPNQQEASQPIITKVSSNSGGNKPTTPDKDLVEKDLKLGGWSDDIYQEAFLSHLKFYTDKKENRPINKSVKIWRKDKI